MKFFVLAMAVGALTVATTHEVRAHARWVDPQPRDNSTSHKNEAFPCGGQPARSPAGQPVTTLVPGSTYMLRFEETVNHPGCFLIDFSPAGEANWQELANVKHVDTPPNPSVAGVAGGTTNSPARPYMQSVTLPNVTCTDCTLRVRQVMMDRNGGEAAPCPPSPLGNVPTYFSCANIVLASAGSTAGAGPGAPAPGAVPESRDTGFGCSVALGSQKSQLGLCGSLLAVAVITLSAARRRGQVDKKLL
jgi:hypothetical protein